MSLTITGIDDCRAELGPAQELRAYQVQPGVADYVQGGYTIPGALTPPSQLAIGWIYGAFELSENLAAANYQVEFILPASSFGARPAPGQSIIMRVGYYEPTLAQSSIGLGSAVSTATNSALTSNVATITAANTFVAGQIVVLQGFANAGFATAGGVNGMLVQIISATASQYTFNFTHANVSSGADAAATATPLVGPSGPVTGSTLASQIATATNSVLTSNVATITAANNFVAGQFVVLQGFTNAGANVFNGQVVQIRSATPTQYTFVFTTGNVTTGADVGTASLLVTGGSPVITGPASTITNSVLTTFVASLTAANSFSTGQFVVINGLTNGATLNGMVLQVIATNLTAALFSANRSIANITTGADVGTASPMIVGGLVEVPTGTDLSACSWFVEFLGY